MSDEAELPPSLAESLNSTKVSYVQLGKSGLRVSVPILGTMSFGHKINQPWATDNEEEFSNLLKAAYDRGIMTWDTANVYSNGLNEAAIGRAIAKWAIPRHKLVLLSKCYGVVGETPEIDELSYPDKIKASKDYVNQGGLSRGAIFKAVDASLKNLQTPYLDVLQIHRFDSSVPIEETMKALHDLVECGKVRYLGASSMWCYQFARMQHVAELKGWTKFVSMQNHYSLLYREEEREMNRFCRESGVGLIPWAPLYRGFLARPYSGHPSTSREEGIRRQPSFHELPEHEREILRRVEELAGRKHWKMCQIALLWILQKGAVPIVGMRTISHLDDACKLRGTSLTEDEMKWLEECYKPKNILGHG